MRLSDLTIRAIKIISVFLLCFCLWSCSGEKSGSFRIGVAQCSSDPWRWQTNDEIERELMFHDNATAEIRSADDRNDKQIADIRYFIDNGFDLIIVNPTEAEAVTPILKEAYDKGIPVLTFDRRINGNSYTAHIEVDNEAIGKAAGEYALSLFPEGADIVELQGNPTMTPTAGRHAGFTGAIGRHSGMHMIESRFAYWNPDSVTVIMEHIARDNPDIDLVYAHSDAMAIRAAEILDRHGLKKVKIIGIDGAPQGGIKAVADSVIEATFLYPTYGYRLIRTALAILEGKPFSRETILPATAAVDRRNAGIMLQQNEAQREETEKILLLKGKLDQFLGRYSTQRSLLVASAAIVVLLFIGLFLFFSSLRTNKRHSRELEEKNRQLEEERDKQKELYSRLDEATQSKLTFFTNVLHDLRTPLTLIEEPSAQVAAQPYLTPRDKTLMEIVSKNAKILRRLIDQILDFRKYESGKLDLDLAEISIYPVISDWTAAFAEVARRRDLKIVRNIPDDSNITVAVDACKLERVFFNLLSNAVKYTPDNGTITVGCQVCDGNLMIWVEDTGCGISEDDIRLIFDRFYRVDKSRPNGSGIGLALTRALIELHGGSITVTSEKGKGSRFEVLLPVRHVPARLTDIGHEASSADVISEIMPEKPHQYPDPGSDDIKPVLLVIDDNRDISEMLTALLGYDYTVLTAYDGKEGIRMATRYVPDLIICDVMMPEMDGLACCRQLKRQITTSHIPVLLLTACSLDEQRAAGYESGADGYISKPFSTQVLKTRCRNLIENRRIITNLCGNPDMSDRRVAHRPASAQKRAGIDNEFYSHFIAIVRREMSNVDLSVEEIASEMGIGQSQFTRKIKSLTNYTPVQLIRKIKVEKGHSLVVSSDKSISEICYEVGFAAPSYFTKCFSDAYGRTPSEVRAEVSKKRP